MIGACHILWVKPKFLFTNRLLYTHTLVPNKKMYMLVHGQGDVHISYKYIIVCVFMFSCHGLKLLRQVLTLK